ncbi:MAG: hypothetical protein L3K26_11865 [Candidatus Hydrogenedentes bacterium]|nr:hypothetical protein [Candidatus Hydrogenedentota bacterium]
MHDYLEVIERFWPTIMQAWEDHADRCPIIECDVVGKTVRAFASGEYIDSLSERTRETTRQDFVRTMDEGGIMVFVMDSKNRVLQSQSFVDVGSGGTRKPNKIL